VIKLRTDLSKLLLLLVCAFAPGCPDEAGDAARAGARVGSTAPGVAPARGQGASPPRARVASTAVAALFQPPPSPDDHGDSPSAATPLRVGDVLSACLERPDDVDWFSVALDPGTPLRCAIHAYGEVRLTLHDRTGAQVLGESAPRGPALTWTPGAPGTFYLRVEAAAGQGMHYTLESSLPALPSGG